MLRFLRGKWYHIMKCRYTGRLFSAHFSQTRGNEMQFETGCFGAKYRDRAFSMKKNKEAAYKENIGNTAGSGLSSRQKVILDALLREYEVALMLDLSDDSYEIFKIAGRFSRALSGMLRDKFSVTMLEVADGCIYSYDYDLFIGAVSLENLRGRLESDGFCSFVFRAITSRGPEYFRLRMIKAEEGSKAFVGVSCIQDEMSRELQQRRLFEGALDRARSADSAKSTFLTNMSHDIRTPMNAIIGFTNIASSHLDDREKVKDALDKIRTSSNHLLSLINDVLDMSRIESGRITIHEDQCDLRDIVESIRNIMQPQMTAKNLTLTIDLEAVINYEVYCDETRITQVLLNLMSNAVKFTEPGGSISLSIRQKQSASGRRYCGYVFRVSDSGIGISRQFLSRVFEPFERETGRIGNSSYGSGLGMSIAKGIVDMMGGSISVESEENVGTQFIVELEFRPAGGDPPDKDRGRGAEREEMYPDDENMAVFPKAREYGAGRDGDVGWIEGRRLLLVEDNPLNREIAEDMLVEDGFKVDTADNGKKALQMIIRSDPWYYSAVLMDIQMPVMDGYEATERIRSLPDRSRSGIPIIAMTANAFKEDRCKAAESGMDAYITKPVDVLALRYVLRRVLR